MKIKQGISLIVLVLTIIVMVILAGIIILTLDDTKIIDKAEEAVGKTNLKEVQSLAAIKWAEAYMTGNKTQVDLETKVINALSEEKIDLTKYDITVTRDGVLIELKGAGEEPVQIPNKWKETIVDIVDTVPIPKGFVASKATGENTKNGGLVIYEGIANVTDANVEEARRNRNQYVWVPVEDFSKFVRKSHETGSFSYRQIANTLGASGHWEVKLDKKTNMPLSTQDSTYMTTTTPEGGITSTLAEVQAMYESVKEYKGFYIARYEAGLDVGGHKTENDGVLIKTIHSKMNKAPYNYVAWSFDGGMSDDTNGAVEVARGIYPVIDTSLAVVSTLIYGVQWDRTLDWWLETKAQNGTKEVTIQSNTELNDSILYGNYIDNEILNLTFNSGASVSKDNGATYIIVDSSYSKTESQSHLLTTGATEETKVNNIYDMAGNVREWTMEGTAAYYRVLRGGSFADNGIKRAVIDDLGRDLDSGDTETGFRPCLYIKK